MFYWKKCTDFIFFIDSNPDRKRCDRSNTYGIILDYDRMQFLGVMLSYKDCSPQCILMDGSR